MKYHQSDKSKHSDRITVLTKVVDKYDYTNVNFPTSYDDINSLKLIKKYLYLLLLLMKK